MHQESIPKVKASGGLLDRMVNQFSATSAGSALSVGTSSTAAAAFMKFSGMTSGSKLAAINTAPALVPSTPGGNSGEKGGGTPVEEILSDKDGILSLDVAEKLLKWHAEAIGRCVELSPSSDLWVTFF